MNKIIKILHRYKAQGRIQSDAELTRILDTPDHGTSRRRINKIMNGEIDLLAVELLVLQKYFGQMQWGDLIYLSLPDGFDIVPQSMGRLSEKALDKIRFIAHCMEGTGKLKAKDLESELNKIDEMRTVLNEYEAELKNMT